MASRSSSTNGNSPLTFDLREDLLKHLQRLQEKLELSSVSSVIRHAVEGFNFSDYAPEEAAHRLISVRLPNEMRKDLQRLAKSKGVSLGELLRVALEAFIPKALKPGFRVPPTSDDTDMKKKAATKKPAAKKAPAKKAKKK